MRLCKHKVTYLEYITKPDWKSTPIPLNLDQLTDEERDKAFKKWTPQPEDLIAKWSTWIDLNEEQKIEADKKQLAYGITYSCEDKK